MAETGRAKYADLVYGTQNLASCTPHDEHIHIDNLTVQFLLSVFCKHYHNVVNANTRWSTTLINALTCPVHPKLLHTACM